MNLPTTFVVEVVLGCNLRCLECPLGAGLISRKHGHMKMEQFQIIAEKIRPYCKYLYLHWCGEPMINPDIIPMIRLASEFARTNISTNANNVDDALAKELIKSGVSDIIVSIDGMSQRTYGLYRRRGVLEKALNGLIALAKHNLKLQKVNIMPQFIVFDHNKHEMRQFDNFCKSIGLKANFKAPYMYENSFLKNSGIEKYERTIYENDEKRKEAMKECKVEDSFVIALDGSVSCCCYDPDVEMPLGNIYTQSVEEIWVGERYVLFREQVKSGDAPDFCMKNCMSYLGPEPTGPKRRRHG